MAFRSDPCSDQPPPYVLPFLTTALSAFFALVTIPGNALVLIAMYRDPYRNLRVPFNYFVLNLAIADLSVGVIVDPLSIIYHVHEGLNISLPGFGIEIENVAYLIGCTASVLSMAFMTVDRYQLAVVHPASYRIHQTKRRITITCAVIWAISSTVSCLYFVIGDSLYRFVFANVVVMFTFCILAFSFFRIHLALQRQRTRLNVQGITSVSTSSAPVHSNDMKYELRVTKMFSIVLRWYVICYLPACVAIYIVNFCHVCSCDVIHWMRDMQLCFLLMSSAVNPYVYAWTSPRFRSAFLKILCLEKYDNRHQEITLSEHPMASRTRLEVS